jgi:hypothetical protein
MAAQSASKNQSKSWQNKQKPVSQYNKILKNHWTVTLIRLINF